MVDCFAGLFHHAVVSGHHQDDKVRHLGATGTHGRKGFMAGRVKEDDFAALGLDVVRADMLRDAPGFAAGDVGLADCVKQRGFAVVDVAHNGDHRRTRLEGFGSVHFLGGQVVIFREACLFHFITKFGSYQGGSFEIQCLVDGGHNAQAKENLDDFIGLKTHLVSHVGYANGFSHADFALGSLQRLCGLRCGSGFAALAPTLAAALACAVVIIPADGIALLEINGAAALETFFLALAVTAVRGGRGRRLLTEATAARTGTARAGRTRAARTGRTGTTRTSRARAAGTGRSACIVPTGTTGAGTTGTTVAGTSASGTRGALFLLGAGGGPGYNTNLRCGGRLTSLGPGGTARSAIGVVSVVGVFPGFGTGFGRTLGQGGRGRTFGHGGSVGAGQTCSLGSLFGFALVLSLVRRFFSRFTRGKRSSHGGNFRNLGLLFHYCHRFGLFLFFAGAADNAGSRNNLGFGGLGSFFNRSFFSLRLNYFCSFAGAGRGGLNLWRGSGFHHRACGFNGLFHDLGRALFLGYGSCFHSFRSVGLVGILAAATYDDAGVGTGTLGIRLFLFGKVFAHACRLLSAQGTSHAFGRCAQLTHNAQHVLLEHCREFLGKFRYFNFFFRHVYPPCAVFRA